MYFPFNKTVTGESADITILKKVANQRTHQNVAATAKDLITVYKRIISSKVSC